MGFFMSETEVRCCLNKLESGDVCRIIIKDFAKIERLNNGLLLEDIIDEIDSNPYIIDEL